MNMEDIDLKLLRAFLFVVRDGSISSAARNLGLSPNAVSVRIRTLEKRLGTRLFDRRAQGMTLTPSGSGLLPAAREIVEMNDRLFDRAASVAAIDSVRPNLPPSATTVSASPKSSV